MYSACQFENYKEPVLTFSFPLKFQPFLLVIGHLGLFSSSFSFFIFDAHAIRQQHFIIFLPTKEKWGVLLGYDYSQSVCVKKKKKKPQHNKMTRNIILSYVAGNIRKILSIFSSNFIVQLKYLVLAFVTIILSVHSMKPKML